MDVAGYLMAEYSTLQHFDIFIYLFAAPFAFFAVAIYFTASAKRIQYHRLFGNMMLKGGNLTFFVLW